MAEAVRLDGGPPGRELHRYLAKLPVQNVWGTGPQTTALLKKHGVETALQFAKRPEAWVQKYFSKTFYEIWQELNGQCVFEIVTGEHDTYYSIQKVKTFTPPSADKAFVFAQLAKNIENARIKIRKYKLAAQRVVIFLRTQQFQDLGLEVDLSGPTQFPSDIIRAVTPAFEELFAPYLCTVPLESFCSSSPKPIMGSSISLTKPFACSGSPICMKASMLYARSTASTPSS